MQTTDLRQVFVLIMAQGEQTRLAELGYPKHLVPINGEPLLGRTLRQLRAHPITQHAPIAVIGRPSLEDGVRDRAVLLELDKPGLCIVDGIAAAFARWSATMALASRTYVLLGDVVWTDAALHGLLYDDRPTVFAGTSDVSSSIGEIFGMSITDPVAMTELVASCPCRVGRDGRKLSLGSKQRGGHLRRLLWWTMQRQGLRADKVQQTWASSIYLPIDDATDDIDTPKDVQRLPLLEAQLAGQPREDRGPERSVVTPAVPARPRSR